MPKPRVIEVPQKQSPRGPPPLRTSSSPSEPLHHRPKTERSPRLAEGRSPRGSAQSEPANKKKLGTRIADLESQLGQAQDELKSLKNQVVSAETTKKVAQEQLEKKPKKQQNVPIQEKSFASKKREEMDPKKSSSLTIETSDDVEEETDVFEVPIETKTELKEKHEDPSTEPQQENLSFDELDSMKDEVNLLKTMLSEKDKELEIFLVENSSLKNKLNERTLELSSAESEIEKLKSRINEADLELESSKSSILQVNEKLEATEKAKEELESEMKRLRVQTEQWRKAADAAAAVLAGGVEPMGKRISERCGSMDKHYGSTFERAAGGYAASPGLIDEDPYDVFEGGKRKGSGIRKIGDLWKKKGQK